jgi:hypothetical protein
VCVCVCVCMSILEYGYDRGSEERDSVNFTRVSLLHVSCVTQGGTGCVLLNLKSHLLPYSPFHGVIAPLM